MTIIERFDLAELQLSMRCDFGAIRDEKGDISFEDQCSLRNDVWSFFKHWYKWIFIMLYSWRSLQLMILQVLCLKFTSS
jgi:hypothetical protein